MFIFIEVGLLIAFGILTVQGLYDAAAVFEWTISFIFSFYVFSFVIDLVPAMYTRKGRGDPYSLRPMNKQEARELRRGGALPGGSVEDALPETRETDDSQRTLTGHNNSAPLGPKPRDF